MTIFFIKVRTYNFDKNFNDFEKGAWNSLEKLRNEGLSSHSDIVYTTFF